MNSSPRTSSRPRTCPQTLVSYIVGVGNQNAMNTHVVAGHRSRDDLLDAVAGRWENLDPAEHPFVRRMAAHLRAHDDCQEFLASIDIILAGLPGGPEAPGAIAGEST